MTREEEEKMIQEWLKNNKVTKLPPDERIAMNAGFINPWKRSDKKTKAKKAKKTKKD